MRGSTRKKWARRRRYGRKKKLTHRIKKGQDGGKSKNAKERTYVFIIPYRARAPQEKRKEQIKHAIVSIILAFEKHNRKFKILVVEQNNDDPFNIGVLKNIGFLEGEKMYDMDKVYMHFNVDYSIDTEKPFPSELDDFDGNGFLDVWTLHPKEDGAEKVIGGCCCFNAESYKKTNGFPNNMFGYGWEDAILRLRATNAGVQSIRNTVTNNGWIKVADEIQRNTSRSHTVLDGLNKEKNDKNEQAHNGLSSCKYDLQGRGDIENDKGGINHIRVNFNFTK